MSEIIAQDSNKKFLLKIESLNDLSDFLSNLGELHGTEDKLFIINNPELFAESVFEVIAEKSIEIRNKLISGECEVKDSAELYSIYKNILDSCGSKVFKSVCKRISINEINSDLLLQAINSDSQENRKILIDAIKDIDSNNYLTSPKTHKQFKKRKIEFQPDFYKPLLEHFVNDLSPVNKSEFLLKIELLRKSGWAEYIQKNGAESEDQIIQELNILCNKKTISKIDSKRIHDLYNEFYKSVALPIVIENVGLSIAKISKHRNVSLYDPAGSGMPDGCVKGCPFFDKENTIFVGWATINQKVDQKLQWFRHIEGIQWAIDSKIKGFEDFKDIDGTVVSLASTSDAELLSFMGEKLNEKELASFQLVNELAETVRGMIAHNGRFKEHINCLSSILLIGSKTNISFSNLDDDEVKNILIKTLTDVCETLKSDKCFNPDFESKGLTGKHQLYFQSISELLGNVAVAYPEEKDFLKNYASPVLIKLLEFCDSNGSTKIKTYFDQCKHVINGTNIQDDDSVIATNKNLSRRRTERFVKYLNHLVDINQLGEKEVKDILTKIYSNDIFPKISKILKNTPYSNTANQTIHDLDHILNTEYIPYVSSKTASNKVKRVKTNFNVYKSASVEISVDAIKLIIDVFQHATPFLNICSYSQEREGCNGWNSSLARFEKLTRLSEHSLVQKLNKENLEIIKEIEHFSKEVVCEIKAMKDSQNLKLTDVIYDAIGVENSKHENHQIDLDLLKKLIEKSTFSYTERTNLVSQIDDLKSKMKTSPSI